MNVTRRELAVAIAQAAVALPVFLGALVLWIVVLTPAP